MGTRRDDEAEAVGVASAVPAGNSLKSLGETLPSLLAMTACPRCRVSTPVARFCTACGTALARRRFCSECGGKLKPAAQVCEACGTKVP